MHISQAPLLLRSASPAEGGAVQSRNFEFLRESRADLAALGGFAEHPRILRQALDACHSKPFPPTLPEFLETCRHFLGSEAVPALPAPKVPRDVAKQRAEQLNAGVEKLASSTRTDHRKWARDILANPSAYPAVSVRFAKEAMATPEAR